MPNNLEFIYWDSCCFIDYISATPGKVDILENVLASVHDDDNKKIVTSVVAKVEVAHVNFEQVKNSLTEAQELGIDSLWADSDVISIIELHDDIALQARRLLIDSRINTPSLKPFDCIHLATALWIKAKEFNTYDKVLLAHSDRYGFPICHPRCDQPRLPGF